MSDVRLSVAWKQMLDDVDKFGEQYSLEDFLEEMYEQQGRA